MTTPDLTADRSTVTDPATDDPATGDPATDDPATDDPADEGHPTPGRASGARRLLPVALAVLLVAAVVIALLAFREASDQRDRADRLAAIDTAERDVAAVAGAFGEALLTYDRADLASARAQIAATATESFLDTYDETFLALEPVISELQAVGVGQADTVYVSEVGDDSAKAVVVLDQRVESTAGTREVTGVYLQVDLVREEGEWRVLLATRIGELGSDLSPIGTPTEDAPDTDEPAG
jgi:hypothetical protein